MDDIGEEEDFVGDLERPSSSQSRSATPQQGVQRPISRLSWAGMPLALAFHFKFLGRMIFCFFAHAAILPQQFEPLYESLEKSDRKVLFV